MESAFPRLGRRRLVSAEEREAGKGGNFTIIYGSTARGLAEDLGVGDAQAQQLIDGYMAACPRVKDWIEEVYRQVGATGYVRTVYGRRRCLPDIWSAKEGKRRRALRQAVNAIIQGTAADIMKLAIGRLYRALPDFCRMILTVHDSVLVEVPQRQARKAAALVRLVMEEPPPRFSVPIVCDVGAGRSWAECQHGAA